MILKFMFVACIIQQYVSSIWLCCYFPVTFYSHYVLCQDMLYASQEFDCRGKKDAWTFPLKTSAVQKQMKEKVSKKLTLTHSAHDTRYTRLSSDTSLLGVGRCKNKLHPLLGLMLLARMYIRCSLQFIQHFSFSYP